MSLITLEQARAHLKAWLDAELAVTKGQSYTIGTRTLTRANLSTIREQVVFWWGRVSALEAKEKRRKRIYRVIPTDF